MTTASGTQLLHNTGVEPRALLKLRRDQQPLSLGFSHLGFHITLAVHGQGIGRDVAGITAHYAGERVPEGGFTVATVTVGNDHGFEKHLTYAMKASRWSPFIMDSAFFLMC